MWVPFSLSKPACAILTFFKHIFMMLKHVVSLQAVVNDNYITFLPPSKRLFFSLLLVGLFISMIMQ